MSSCADSLTEKSPMSTVVYGPLWYDCPSDFPTHTSQGFMKRTLSVENISLTRSAFPVGFLARLRRKRPTSTRRAPFANWGGGSRKVIRSGKPFVADGSRGDMAKRPLWDRVVNYLSDNVGRMAAFGQMADYEDSEQRVRTASGRSAVEFLISIECSPFQF
jgi:hypothetical protein